ncbi:MAG TPA: hypothetical protein PLL00_11220 [Bacteroidia bacterium]|nr:hypothetical protein [Bacteroidia bacterium]
MKLGKKITLNLEQLFYYTFSSLLIVMIAVLCLKLSANTITVFPRKGNIAIKLNKSLAENTSCIRYSNGTALLSTPYAYAIVLKQVVDGQVYTPNKRKEKASNIKKNLSLAIFKIVTARC